MGIEPGIAVNVAGIKMKNPVMAASGTFGYGKEYTEFVDLAQLGALVVKGITLEACPGNPPPRLVETPSGLLNAVGLENAGVEAFIEDKLPFLREAGVPVLVNISGEAEEEYIELAQRLSRARGVDGIELNISCPNVKGALAFSQEAALTSRLVGSVRKVTELPLIVKLSPGAGDITESAKACEGAGADAVSLVNSFPAMAIDVESRCPKLGNITGGLTGPAIHPIAVLMVWRVAREVKVPVIGMGGIMCAEDALEFIIAGAAAVAIGTANLIEPDVTIKVIDGIKGYLKRGGFSDIGQIVGSMDSNCSRGNHCG